MLHGGIRHTSSKDMNEGGSISSKRRVGHGPKIRLMKGSLVEWPTMEPQKENKPIGPSTRTEKAQEEP